MRLASLALSGVLAVGCASPSQPMKPFPYRYTANAPTLTLGALTKDLS
jgi:hypothetical protein